MQAWWDPESEVCWCEKIWKKQAIQKNRYKSCIPRSVWQSEHRLRQRSHFPWSARSCSAKWTCKSGRNRRGNSGRTDRAAETFKICSKWWKWDGIPHALYDHWKMGSAPRSIGTQMLVTSDNRMIGTIGGGCAEAEVITRCRGYFAEMRKGIHGICEIVKIQMSTDNVEEEGMVCGGRIEVLLEETWQGMQHYGMQELIVNVQNLCINL